MNNPIGLVSKVSNLSTPKKIQQENFTTPTTGSNRTPRIQRSSHGLTSTMSKTQYLHSSNTKTMSGLKVLTNARDALNGLRHLPYSMQVEWRKEWGNHHFLNNDFQNTVIQREGVINSWSEFHDVYNSLLLILNQHFYQEKEEYREGKTESEKCGRNLKILIGIFEKALGENIDILCQSPNSFTERNADNDVMSDILNRLTQIHLKTSYFANIAASMALSLSYGTSLELCYIKKVLVCILEIGSFDQDSDKSSEGERCIELSVILLSRLLSRLTILQKNNY